MLKLPYAIISPSVGRVNIVAGIFKFSTPAVSNSPKFIISVTTVSAPLEYVIPSTLIVAVEFVSFGKLELTKLTASSKLS